MMRNDGNLQRNVKVIASQKIKERDYWLHKLSGDIEKSYFPYDYRGSNSRSIKPAKFSFDGELFLQFIKLIKASDIRLFVILVAGLVALLNKYTGKKDILVGAPIYKQDVQGKFINTILPLRNQVTEKMTFKELVLTVSQTIKEANENQNYPMETLLKQLNMSMCGDSVPLFDAALLLRNIHDKAIIAHIDFNMMVTFSRTEEALEGELEYNASLYRKTTIERIIKHFTQFLQRALFNPAVQVADIDILTEREKKQLLIDFNDTKTGYPRDKTIHELFEEQVEKTPGNIAITFENKHLSYRELNKKSNQLARVLRSKGVERGANIGIMVERSIEMIVGILAILKAGASYLPIDADSPGKRVKYMLNDGNVPVLLTESSIIKKHSFIELQGLQTSKTNLHLTKVREQIIDLEKSLPIPDRSLVDYEKYNKDIGMAMATHTIAIQATRGCPYKCLYCHKIWPKKHVIRLAEHILAEMQIYYNMGIRRFVLIDDIFNLNKENSTRFFKLIIKNKMDVQLFFPNGLRGDILTKDYIDLMVEAGTINLALALETASPRLQKLIKKNLNVEKLHQNMAYICETYPHVISELFTMHGFPTETESEAKMTMDFIKSLKWIHLPHINILKIYPNTDMADFAINSGISEKAIARSENLAYHELPETLSFDKNFTLEYQAEFLDYMLSKERLLHVLPYQLKVLTRSEMLQKYNSFLPTEINEMDDLLKLANITRDEWGQVNSLDENCVKVPGLNRKMKQHFIAPKEEKNALKILLIDVSRFFGGQYDMLYDVSEPPLGLIYLLTYLKRTYGGKINGKIVKSRTDFDSYTELKTVVEEFKPALIGIRTLTYFNQFFHKTVAMIRHWGFDVPIIAGGPYATSDYKRVLQDRNVDLVVLGEGEVTLNELVGKIMDNGGKLPGEEVLKEIAGIAFMPTREAKQKRFAREIIMLDMLSGPLQTEPGENLVHNVQAADLAYTMYTSGSTGEPKGVLVEHGNVVRLVKDTNFVDFSESDRLLPTGALDFDASTFEIWGTLLNGLRLQLSDKETILTPEKLKETIGKYGITLMWLTSPLFNHLVEAEIDIFSGLINLVVGGDTLSPAHIGKVRKRFPGLKIINGYGPTENTTFSTTFLIAGGYNENIPIGSPINDSTAYIVGKKGELQPLGAPGELYVGGDGVSRGYLNNPELTAETFRRDVIRSSLKTHDRLYKTGDLARWLPDGNIEFLGRMDQQVKIRGYRIELGEIESKLLEHKEINNTIVIVSSDEGCNKFLAAYIVPRSPASVESLEVHELRKYLAGDFPDYMIPSYFVLLDNIPLTSNGKVDRRSLPPPGVSKEARHELPRDEVEEKMVKIWSEVLGINKVIINIDANFFELGGHSLNATILISKLYKAFDVKIPLAELFKDPTIMALAEYVRGLTSMEAEDRFLAIEAVEEKEYYPLSSAQKRLYVLQQLELENTSYNIPQTFVLEGASDKEKLEATFNKLIKRHDSLRTSVEMINGKPIQRIHDEIDFEIEYDDLKGAQVEVEREKSSSHAPGSTLQANSIKNVVRPFDLSQAPLLRVGLIKTDKSRAILMIDMHHIITDGTSQDILQEEFMAIYTGDELEPLRLQYKDFSEWQNREKQGERLKQQELYWVNAFSDELPVLTLPTDYSRPLMQSFEGSSVNFVLNEEETRALKDMAKDTDVTLYMYILSIYTILLSKLSGREDIIVGTPIAARRHTDLEHIIGMFVNTLAMRNYPAGEKRFEEFLDEVKERTLAAFENQEYQFEDLVDNISVQRDTSRNPIFDVMFNLLNRPDYAGNIPGIDDHEQDVYEHRKGTSKFDLNLTAVDIGKRIYFTFKYCTRLFKAGTIERMIRYFKKTLSLLSLSANRGSNLSKIEIITEEEKERILQISQGVEEIYDTGRTIHQLFEVQAAGTPDSIAVVGTVHSGKGCHALTYRELNKKSDRLAHRLRAKGVKSNQVVALMVHRSLEMIIGILGILKAGGAYLPLDPNDPEERIKYILEDSNARILVCKVSDVSKVSEGIEVIGLDKINENSTLPPTHPFTHSRHFTQLSPGNLAYVIYTSGSTGKPKGVLLKHENLVNYVHWFAAAADLKENDKTILTSSFAFDLGYTSLYTSILKGCELHILPREIYLLAVRLLDYIKQKAITYIKVTPSLFSVIVNAPNFSEETCKSLRLAVIGGEAINVEDIGEAHSICSHLQIMNHYGPTEATIGSVATFIDFHKFGEYKKYPYIGKPIHNTGAFILGKDLNLLPVGVPGELCISGTCLARGYLNRPGLTAEKFDRDFWDYQDYQDEKEKEKSTGKLEHMSYMSYKLNLPYLKLYRTGDLARWLPNGNIEFLGRIDNQVKIRGYRIELDEIENRLLKHNGIKEAVVLAMSDGAPVPGGLPGDSWDKYLCAYIVPNIPGVGAELREYLSHSLPDYMIPSYFVEIEKILLTPNGKIDRKALPGPGAKAVEKYAAPRNEIEKKLAELWADVLGLEKGIIGIDNNFFELGGHSLKATILISKVHKSLNVKVSLAEIFKKPTIRQLCTFIEAEEKDRYVSIEAVEEKEYYRLSPAQKRLYILQQMEPGSTAYNMPRITILEGEMFEKIFRKLIDRHESLRTSFRLVEDEPVQKIHNDVEFGIEYHEARHTSTEPGAQGEEPYTSVIENFVRPFDLTQAPLLRVGLVKIGEAKHFLMVDMHHIISDGVSHNILFRDYMTLYNGDTLPPLRLQYRDFAQWQNTRKQREIIKAQEKYWLEEFEGTIPLLSMPTDYVRPDELVFEGSFQVFAIDNALTGKIKTRAFELNVTLMMFLLSVYKVLLTKYTGQEEIVVGTVAVGRRHADLEGIIGFFVNMLALRTKPNRNKTFLEFLMEVKGKAIQAYDNQDYPFEDLVNKLQIPREPGRHPLIDTVFVMRNAEDMSGERAAPATNEVNSNPYKTSHFDLMFHATDTGDSINMFIEYSTALFKDATIEELSMYYVEILKQVVESKDIRLNEIKVPHDLLGLESNIIQEDRDEWEL